MQLRPELIVRDCPYQKATPDHHQYHLGKGTHQIVQECFVRSCTPKHECSKATNGQRCQYALQWGQELGWQGWVMRPAKPISTKRYVLEAQNPKAAFSVRTGEFTTIDPREMILVYSPANEEGTAWIAVCSLTGERKAIDPFIDTQALDGSLLKHPFRGWTLIEDFLSFLSTCAACLHPDGCREHSKGAAIEVSVRAKALPWPKLETEPQSPLKTRFRANEPISLSDLLDRL